MEFNKIYHGDCLELMKQIPDQSIDMILCDLPYGVTDCKWDEVIPMEPLWAHYKRIIKPKGAIVLTATQPFASKLIMSNPKMYRYEWIWEKPNGTNPLQVKIRPFASHEHVLIFGNSNVNYYPQINQGKPYHTKVNGEIFTNANDDIKRIDTINTGTRYPRSVIKFNYDSKRIHSTQKPVALFEYLIRTYSLEGQIVLDNCSGSGTTAIAAMNTNRNYICMELDKEIYDKSQERIRSPKETPQQQLGTQ